MAKEQETNSYTMKKDTGAGEVLIANDVVATIGCVAATEVEGVASLSGNLTNEIIGKLGVKNLSKGMKIELKEGFVYAELSLTMKYGHSIPKTCSMVQDRVKSSIESMTGLKVAEVNIHIVGVNMDK